MSIQEDFLFSKEQSMRSGTLEYEANKLMIDKKYSKAREIWLQIYAYLIAEQERESRRIHKGGVLFQLGILALLENNQEEGLKYMLKAYIEDALSYLTDVVDQLPAARALEVFALKKPLLTQLKEKAVSRKIPATTQPRIPDDILNEVLTQNDVPLTNISSVAQRRLVLVGAKTSLDNLPGPPEKRVFLGGNYDNIVVLREIRRLIDDLGFPAVFGDDYIVPQDQTYTADLGLLSQCTYAVFEVTMSNGHLIEIQSAISSGKKVILIYQARDMSKTRPSSLSSMLYTSPARTEGYVSLDELKTILHGFLT